MGHHIAGLENIASVCRGFNRQSFLDAFDYISVLMRGRRIGFVRAQDMIGERLVMPDPINDA